MALDPINVGDAPNDGTGDPLRTCFTKTNANDADLQQQITNISLTPGPAGPQGDPGPTGPAGAVGSVWRDGVGAPSNGTGLNGDWYLNRTNGDYYEKTGGAYVLRGNLMGPTGATGSQGIQGIQGIQGNTGANGAPGSVWRSGSGAPSNAVGVDGDFYLRTSNGDVYTRSGGAYSVTGNILGPQGPAGSTGSAGANGNKGWSPAFAIISDGARRVLQVNDWVGGEGAKPATGDYVGAAGLTAVLANAVDIRGPSGAASGQKTLSVILPGAGDVPTLFYTNAIITISKVTSVVVGSASPSVTWNLKHATDRSAAGTDLIAAPVTTTNTTTGATNNTFTGTVPANSWIWLNITAISGTVEQFHITLDY